MEKVTNIFAIPRMDSDTNYSFLDNKSYSYLLNMRPTGYGENGTLRFIKGSEQIADYSENGTMVSVRMFQGDNNKLYNFLARADGFSKIIETDVVTRLSRVIIQDYIHLRFDLFIWQNNLPKTKRYYLNSVNQIGNFLVFSSEFWERPRSVDLTKSYLTSFTLSDVIINKKPPEKAPVILDEYVNNSKEDLRNRFVSFAYRYKYADSSYSVLSFYSDPAFIEKGQSMNTNDKRENTSMVNKLSGVKLSINSGDERVVGVEVIAREHDTNNGYIIYTADKDKLNIQDNSIIEVKYNFSSNYTLMPPNVLDLLYSNIPKYPKAQDYIGSRLFFANYKENYDLKDKDGNNVNIDMEYRLDSIEINDFEGTKRTTVSLFNYKLGIVYYDEYNECTTVLGNNDDTKNEIYVPFEKRTFMNSIKAKINSTQKPPEWAVKFKWVVMSQKLNYENIFSGLVRKFNDKLYILLDNDNLNKLKKDDKFFLTASSITQYEEMTVNDVQFIKNIDIPLGVDGTYAIVEGAKNLDIKQNSGESGVKLKVALADIDSVDVNVLTTEVEINDSIPGQKIFGNLYVNDRITINITSKIKNALVNTLDINYTFEQTIIIDQDYNNIYDAIADKIDVLFYDYSNTTTSISFIGNNFLLSKLKAEYGLDGTEQCRYEIIASIFVIRGNAAQFIRTLNKDVIDTFYYEANNTFDIVNNQHTGAGIDGYHDTGFFNGIAWGNGMESFKIKDDFNGRALSQRFRPNLSTPIGYNELWRKNDITYSGLYNQELKINELPLFNPITINWKSLPPEHGEITKIISTDGNIKVFCLDKVINQYYGKSIIADMQGNENVALSDEVLGGYYELPYKYGCQHPESVVYANNLIHWVDAKRTRILATADKEITELNSTETAFLQEGVDITMSHQNFPATYDYRFGDYILGLDHNEAVVFNFEQKGFSHYYNHGFDSKLGMLGKIFTTYQGVLYEDEVTEQYNNFAGQGNFSAKVKFVVNPEMVTDKIYNSMYIQSNTAWNTEVKTNLTATKFSENVYDKRESYYYTEIFRDSSTKLGVVGIGRIQAINGNQLVFNSPISNQVTSNDSIINESGSVTIPIANIFGKTITVASITGLSVGDFVGVQKGQVGDFRPNGVPIRGENMEVTLTKSGSEPYYITSVSTIFIPGTPS